ncbi:TIGR04282 family arsenosugar biosynthesis glycosyltransferase [Actinomadura barringtoniae]|uniref:TIGR04282 family arsenosugar biosynthesis glycosyltransferase n=1 Tax=Actinomadura barringtoniae TaxID=1427535 RepID=A0A939PHL8_9ACTN|nr:TIGR04282 family arsenosugar biosynthesis glycosyltransferase [Actinomadura barringtoniae]MBO2449344.1 TIGR04282 family arsenosugar biosynthesis glycosyltransferase [Actinomadura barringtoniae]
MSRGERAVADLIVIAKEPIPGRVKTRLTPPCTPEEGAALAEAALADTLTAVAETPAGRRTLALAGRPGHWLPYGMTVIPQRGAGLDERLGHAFADAYAGRPLVLIGMDTPQVTPGLLTEAAEALRTHDAVFGPASDGGFWLLGLRRPDPDLIRGVPMSEPHTGAAQLARLRGAGLSIATSPELTDVDTAADALHVASLCRPGGRFPAAVQALGSTLRPVAAT